MGSLNTKKLMKQCRQIAAKQEEAKKPKLEPEILFKVEVKEEMAYMTPIELEAYLTQFLQTARDAQRRYEEAVALELYPNEAIQDILHAAEFAPSTLEGVDVTAKLHEMREMRRTAKQELEITDIFKQWADENKAAMNKLENVLGSIRKVLKWQPNAFYQYKTDIIGEKGRVLVVDEKPEIREEDNNEA